MAFLSPLATTIKMSFLKPLAVIKSLQSNMARLHDRDLANMEQGFQVLHNVIKAPKVSERNLTAKISKHSEGWEDGFSFGKNLGYQDGYDIGRKDGYNLGQKKIHHSSFLDGTLIFNGAVWTVIGVTLACNKLIEHRASATVAAEIELGRYAAVQAVAPEVIGAGVPIGLTIGTGIPVAQTGTAIFSELVYGVPVARATMPVVAAVVAEETFAAGIAALAGAGLSAIAPAVLVGAGVGLMWAGLTGVTHHPWDYHVTPSVHGV